MSDTPITTANIWYENNGRGCVYAEICEKLERENAALREERDALRRQAVEVLMIGRAWIMVWSDHLSAPSVEQFITLEKQILKQGEEAQP